MVVSDFNGDGKLDVAVTNRGSSTVGILLGNGAGGSLAPRCSVRAVPMRLTW